jgi:osmotically-inducible protein OsmY
MQEHERGRRRPSQPRSGQTADNDAYRNYDDGDARSMTTRSATRPQQERDEWSGQESGGGWSGYVVPYRYYGPGYRGVGYYTVMYQGGGEGDAGESESQYGQRGNEYRQESGWDTRADATASNQSARGFAGRGPKGYRRSDERVREDLSDRLMADERIDASDIEVRVENGEVTLTGTVEDRLAKRRAEDCAEQVMGVRDVMNQLRVQAGGSERGSDDRGTAGMQARSQPRQDWTSSQEPKADRNRSADAGSTGSNGRRKTTSSR